MIPAPTSTVGTANRTPKEPSQKFGPDQFQDLYPALTEPAAGGLLFLAGEAISIHHAWIAGAIDSMTRSVNGLGVSIKKRVGKAGRFGALPPEVDYDILEKQTLRSKNKYFSNVC